MLLSEQKVSKKLIVPPPASVYLYKQGIEEVPWQLGYYIEGGSYSKQASYLASNPTGGAGSAHRWFTTTNKISVSGYASIELIGNCTASASQGQAGITLTSTKRTGTEPTPWPGSSDIAHVS